MDIRDLDRPFYFVSSLIRAKGNTGLDKWHVRFIRINITTLANTLDAVCKEHTTYFTITFKNAKVIILKSDLDLNTIQINT